MMADKPKKQQERRGVRFDTVDEVIPPSPLEASTTLYAGQRPLAVTPTQVPSEKNPLWALRDAAKDERKNHLGPQQDIAFTASEMSMLYKRFQQGVNDVKKVVHTIEGIESYGAGDDRDILVGSFRELGLDDKLVTATTDASYFSPSRIQCAVIPRIVKDPNISLVVQAKNGTGKTAAFALALLQRINLDIPQPQILVVVPTRELAEQVALEFDKLGQYLRASGLVECLVKGTQLPDRVSAPIVVGTPGRLLGSITNRASGYLDCNTIASVVLDEADVLLDESSGELQQQALAIFKFIEDGCAERNAPLQRILVSATYPNEIRAFVGRLLPTKRYEMTVPDSQLSLSNVVQYQIKVKYEDKNRAVMLLFGMFDISSAVICFCHSRDEASSLAEWLRNKNYKVALLHGGMNVASREQAMKEIRDGRVRILVTTNLCSRGVDFCSVSLVVNVDPPARVVSPAQPGHAATVVPDFEGYLHRVGRAGRFGRKGIAVTLVDSKLASNLVSQYAERFNCKIDRITLDESG